MTTYETPVGLPMIESLHAEHERLLDHAEHIRIAALELPSLSPEERREVLSRIIDFVRHDLAAQAEGEEHSLYPWVARLLGDSRATAPMVYDHDAIRQVAARLKEASVNDVPLLQELLYGLHALITLHFRKEEELCLPLLASDGADGHMARRRDGFGDD